MTSAARLCNLVASISLLALLALCLAWELWWAPLRPGGSWLVLKALPLLAPLFGVLRARRYTHQWLSMLALAYLVEGLVRSYADQGLMARLALLEALLALVLFVATAGYARLTGKVSRRNTAADR